MQIPRSYVENYSKALNVVSDRARAQLVDTLARVDYTADVADVRNAVIAIMQQACGASSTMAARLAADFYDGLRARFGIDDGYMAEVDSRREPEATEGAVRAFAQDLVDEKPVEQFIGKCADRIDYETRRAANECMAHNARRDPRKPKWARVPVGSETCSFCIMLASRGFAYQNEDTASHAHANCDCRVIVSWDKSPSAQGYDPDKYYEMWKNGSTVPKSTNVDGEVLEQALRDYTHGSYGTLVGYSDYAHGGRTMWENKQFREGDEAFAERWAKDVTDEERKMSEAIYSRIVSSDEKARTIVRTERDNSGIYPTREGQMYGAGRSERFGKTPDVGMELSFGIKSASKDAQFAEKIARDEISGMGNPYGTVAETGSEVLAYRVKNATRYLDIERYSDYGDQKEVLIAGRYRVVDVRVEEITVGGGNKETVAVTPREYAEHEGLEIEYFTSKKGVEMARFGTRTYPVDKLDAMSNLTIEREAGDQKVKIKYVDLEEID